MGSYMYFQYICNSFSIYVFLVRNKEILKYDTPEMYSQNIKMGNNHMKHTVLKTIAT